MTNKIISSENLENVIKNIRQQDKKIVFTNGCFDILHVGHVRYLTESSKFGDVLIVGVNSDSSVKRLKGDSRPLNNQNDRLEVLSALEAVDYVALFEEDTPENLLKIIKPDIYTKGADYTVETLPEARIVFENGGKVEFIDLVKGKSTTNIINEIRK